MGTKEYDFNKQIRSIEDGFETNLPKRLDIIALGFAEKYDSATVDLVLEENGCEKLYARSFPEATLIYAYDNGLSYEEWKEIYDVCQKLMESLSAGGLLSGGKISLKTLREYVFEESSGDSFLTGKMTQNLLAGLKRINKPTDLISFVNENKEKFSDVRERARYYFCKYLLLYIEKKCDEYKSACEKTDMLMYSCSVNGIDMISNPELDALDELAFLKPLTELKREAVKTKNRMSSEEKMKKIENSNITPGGVFDEFNYFYFGYVSAEKIELLFELYGDLEDWPIKTAKEVAHALGLCSASPEAEELEAALEKLSEMADQERNRQELLDCEYGKDAAESKLYQRGRSGEDFFRDIISGKRDINRALLITFLIFASRSAELGRDMRINRMRLNEILLNCGFSQLRPDNDFDSFCMRLAGNREALEIIEDEMAKLVSHGKDFYLYKVYKDSYCHNDELLKYMVGIEKSRRKK